MSLVKNISAMRIKKKYFKSKYTYVCGISTELGSVWRAKVGVWSKHYETEIEAARGVDMRLIRENREPINILKQIKL